MKNSAHTKSNSTANRITSSVTTACILLCIAFHSSAAFAQSKAAKAAVKQQTYYALQLLSQASVKADAKMLDQTNKISDRLFKLGKAAYPSTPDEVSALETKLNENLEENPYISKEFEQEAGVALPELQLNRSKNRVTVLFDPSISINTAAIWIENPPTKLNKPAGSICVIQNGFDLALIYATSIESKPVKDSKTGKAHIIIQQPKILH